ncbi:MAG TPA: PilZ domain-containing protein [Pyrinomonadaceae bacterium]|nr:PilZ domain-containing protein [Pyrinomonadaceae bacterium]
MRQSKTKPTMTTTQTNERPALSVVVRWREGAGAERVETTTLHGATPRSATLTLEGQPELGQLLCLLLPSAARRAAGQRKESDTLNRLWALVWAVSRAAGGREEQRRPVRNHVSVVFLGGEAPARQDEQRAGLYAYLAEEDGRFRLQQGADGADAADAESPPRRDSRLLLPIEVTVELLNEDGSASAREQTVTENISRRGACVWTMFGVGRGSFVRLTCEQQNVSLISVVRARRTGDDGIGRLHLEFVDGQWPIGANG